MNLVYTAYDKTGKVVKGTIDSSDVATAGQTLRQRGLFVAQISDGSAPTSGAKPSRRLPRRFGGNEAAKNIPMFTRQLCVFMSCGTQMLEALRSLERQAKPGPWQDTIAGICVRVEQGASLSEALGAYPQHFDSVYRSLVSGRRVERMPGRDAGPRRDAQTEAEEGTAFDFRGVDLPESLDHPHPGHAGTAVGLRGAQVHPAL